ncbi:SUKH-3 domain-containing protein [Paenibacillus sp. 32352]|uniref:SUKH-3 domain-containing protein n=1 Tax=Paenibacillus sp. 32352 TaxID=1969111 RepID=UPI0009AD2632|nr:SUKH-3 domain-containing protein [Paenibacillus sp. 32352]
MEQAMKKPNKREQMKLLLKKAGWHEGRHVDISGFERRCKEQGIDLFDSAKAFLQEFAGIDDTVYFKYHHNQDSSFSDSWYDYTFDFTPDALEELTSTEDYHDIVKFAQEDCFRLGESGYYYPAVAAIGRSGKLYFKHDYEDVVRVFDDLLESMEHELNGHELVLSSLFEENRVIVSTLWGKRVSPEKRPNPFQ